MNEKIIRNNLRIPEIVLWMFHFWPESIRGSGGYAAIDRVPSFHFQLRSDSEPGECLSLT